MMQNVISVDLEEYFHAANLEPVIGPARWHAMESRVEYSTNRVLELFDNNQVCGTFFILGSTARRHPKLIQTISRAGHEIASHGYGHRLAYQQSEKQFYRDVRRSKLLLEQLTGQKVLGYRAPNFSLTANAPWAYDCLVKAGYEYDSSRYPIKHPRYSNADKGVSPELLQCAAGKIVVFPLAVHAMNFFSREVRLPVAGGAYWRLLPRMYNRWGLEQIARRRREPFCCYFHPWELDCGQPQFPELSFLTRLRHYGGSKSFFETVHYYLQNFSFGPFRSIVEEYRHPRSPE